MHVGQARQALAQGLRQNDVEVMRPYRYVTILPAPGD